MLALHKVPNNTSCPTQENKALRQNSELMTSEAKRQRSNEMFLTKRNWTPARDKNILHP